MNDADYEWMLDDMVNAVNATWKKHNGGQTMDSDELYDLHDRLEDFFIDMVDVPEEEDVEEDEADLVDD